MSAAARAAGVNFTCWTILCELALDGRLTNGQLAERLGMSTGGVTPAVDRLAALGYIERSRNPADRRSSILSITAEGKAVLRRSGDVLHEALRPALAELGEAGHEAVARFLAALEDAYAELQRRLDGGLVV